MSSHTSFLSIAFRADIALRSAKIALVVGTLIAIINHGDRMMMDKMGTVDWLKCALTYLVPFGVSTWSQVSALRART